MQLPTVQKCCLCVDLRTGSIVIGFFAMIGELTSCIQCAVQAEEMEDSMKSSSISASVMAGIMMVTNLMMMIGAYLEKPLILKIWLVIHSLQSALLIGFLFIVTFILAGTDNGDSAAVVLFVTLLVMVFLIYDLIVVYSYYVNLTGGEANRV